MNINIFKELELDPKVKDVKTIVDAANKKISDWNKLANHPTKKLLIPTMVANFKAIIDEVSRNPQILDEHAKEFVKLQQEEKREQEKALRDAASMLVVNGEIDEKVLDNLTKQYSQYSKDEILKILGARIKQKKVFKYVDDGVKELEKSMFNEINSNLKIVNKKNLYDFLNLKPTSSLNEIQAKKDEKYKECQDHATKTPEVTAAGLLCGQISAVLCNDDKRKSYHKSLENIVFADIKVIIDQVALSNTKIIYPEQYKTLVDDCAKKGIDYYKAEFFIYQYCETKNVTVVESGGGEAAKMISCRICSTLNDPQVAVCKECAFPLIVTCPNCGKTSSDPKELKCTKCGFSIGDMPNAENELIQAEKSLIINDFNTAKQHLAKAEYYWKTYSKIADFKKRLGESQSEIESHLKKLDEYKNEKKFQAIKDYIVRQKIGVSVAATYISDADAAIAKAKAECAKARAQSNNSAKIESFMQALLICADLKEAEDELINNPPQTPTHLKVTVTGKKIQINWDKLPSNLIRYSIVRKEDGKPANQKDGVVIAPDLAGNSFDDINVEAGNSYYYAVYSKCGIIYSKMGAVNEDPVLLVSDIDNLIAVPSEKEINFTFTLPDNAKRKAEVEVYRDGKMVKTVSGGVFGDSGLVTDKQYDYKFVAVFTDCLNKKHYAAGIQLQATPTSPPKPVVLNEDEKKSDKIAKIITWSPPAKGTVVLYLCDQKQKFLEGQMIDVKSFAGKFVNINTANNMARIDLNFHGAKYLYPITTHIGVSVIGAPLLICSALPVAATFDRQDRYIDIYWKWEQNVQAVEVMAQSEDNAGSWKIISESSGQQPTHRVAVSKETQSITLKIRNYLKTSEGTVIVSDEISKTFTLRAISVSFVEVSGGGLFSKSDFKVTLQCNSPIPCDLHVLIGEGRTPLDTSNYTPHLTISQKDFVCGTKPVTFSLKYARNDKSKPLIFRIIPAEKAYFNNVVMAPETRKIN